MLFLDLIHCALKVEIRGVIALILCMCAGHGMEWNGNFGMECGRCQNGMEWKISRMKWKTIFHTSIPIPY